MRPGLLQTAIVLCLAGLAFAQVAEPVSGTLRQHQYDLFSEGSAFLKREAEAAHFFMLGELHGENEIPALVRELWPDLWRAGYRHIAAEMSPWAAQRLLNAKAGSEPFGAWSWSQSEFEFVVSFAKEPSAVFWGCDMEESRPDFLIQALAAANPTNHSLTSATQLVKSGYERRQAPELLRLLKSAGSVADRSIGGRSLKQSVVETLEIEVKRLDKERRLLASLHRESVMKEIFYGMWIRNAGPKVFLRFGRNHLHRGYDRRGVSTLGNFVAELGSAHGKQTFNLAVFATGGKIFWQNQLLDWDERKDDLAFEYLASIAQYPATVFDLRPIRQSLHRVPESKRSPTEVSLIYWADSYDAILCFRAVTPIRSIAR